MYFTIEDFVKGLDEIMLSDKFIVKGVTPVYAYENGKRTDKIQGYRYTLIDPEVYETFDIKVKGTNPVITNEMVTDRENRVYVALENAIIKPYKIEYGRVSCSVVADSIRVLSE